MSALNVQVCCIPSTQWARPGPNERSTEEITIHADLKVRKVHLNPCIFIPNQSMVQSVAISNSLNFLTSIKDWLPKLEGAEQLP